jgi:hypothetical protein
MSYAEIEFLTWEQMYEELGLNQKDPWQFFYERQQDQQTKIFDALCESRNITPPALALMPIADVMAILSEQNPKMKIEEPMVRSIIPLYIKRKLEN